MIKQLMPPDDWSRYYIAHSAPDKDDWENHDDQSEVCDWSRYKVFGKNGLEYESK